jgi:hypothetical protein
MPFLYAAEGERFKWMLGPLGVVHLDAVLEVVTSNTVATMPRGLCFAIVREVYP